MNNEVPKINLDNTSEGTFIRANVLSVPEAAEKLHLTKQRIYALIKTGQLKPAKSDNVTLFSVSEIDRFTKARIQKAQIQNNGSFFRVFYDHKEGTTTSESVASWATHKGEIDNIEQIRIYRYSNDAARDGYFEIGSPAFGSLHYFDAPTMVIRAKNGVQLWLEGCCCGYCGEGPRGSVRVLMEAQESGLLKTSMSEEEWKKYVFNEKRCVIYRSNFDNSMTCHAEAESIEARDDKISEVRNPFNNTYPSFYFDVQFFARDGHLVLVQSDQPMRSSEAEKKFILGLYMDYIPNPISFTCYPTRDAAKTNGYYCISARGKVTGYQIILVDADGTEIWFESINDSNINLAKNETIRDLFQTLGYDLPIEKSSLPMRISSWINNHVIKAQQEQAKPLFITFKQE